METVTDFFVGSKITADHDCSHEIKRRLLFGRKADQHRQQNKKQRADNRLSVFLIFNEYFRFKKAGKQQLGFRPYLRNITVFVIASVYVSPKTVADKRSEFLCANSRIHRIFRVCKYRFNALYHVVVKRIIKVRISTL